MLLWGTMKKLRAVTLITLCVLSLTTQGRAVDVLVNTTAHVYFSPNGGITDQTE
jgi:hypothetical protein